MSQNREKEETVELKVPAQENLTTLCPDNCKISASAATKTNTNTAASQTCSGSTNSVDPKPDSARIDSSSHFNDSRPVNLNLERRDSFSVPEVAAVAEKGREAAAALLRKTAVNRCCSCGKRVGLTGFRCRCGELFCCVHRYSDRHDCSFDYKAAGREAIARENPVVRAAKILKV